MREFTEGLMYLLFVVASISVLICLGGYCHILIPVASFLIGAFFGSISRLIKNQERIISLLEKSQNEEEKENRTE